MESGACRRRASDVEQSAWAYSMTVECEPVKEEPEWGECGVSEAAVAEGLYAGHEVKDEVVIGPEVVQQQDIAFSMQNAACRLKGGLWRPKPEGGIDAAPACTPGCPGDGPCCNMSHKQHLKLRRISVSRSRSATPWPEEPWHRLQATSRRKLIMGALAGAEKREIFIEPEPKPWRPPVTLIGHNVNRTPGCSLRLAEEVPVTQTPQGSIRRKMELEQSMHITMLERAAACDLDDEEGEATVKEHYDHVKKWVGELLPPETMDKIPSRSKSVSEVSCGDISGTVSVLATHQPESQPGPSGYYGESQMTLDDVDVRPSTSGKTATSKRPVAGLVAYGSEFDSDYDDEFDLNEITTNAGITRGIPDDEDLEDPVSNLINSTQREMDEAIERLVNTSNVFNWHSDFDTFRGVPEKFSGPTPGSIKDYDIPYDAFTHIWSRDIMEHIAKETNRYAKKVIADKIAAGTLKESSRLRRWVDTDVDELYVLFAVYILMGVDPRSSDREYFKSGGFLEMPRFRELITYNRFIMLNKFIHFEDNPDESQELPQSERAEFSARLRKIAPVLSHLNRKFQSIYNLHQDVAIDESLALFKGRLSWVQAIGSKAARFGIKSYELCESRTGFLFKFIIYTGKNSERGNVTATSAELAGKSAEVVLELLKGLEYKGHRVTMDNFYNSPSLARYLKSLGFDCLGTLRPNRKNVPNDIAKASKNVPKGTIIARHSGDVSCISWKDTKIVNMISTYHNAETFVDRKVGRPLVKPLVVRDYNNTMGGVDLKDQKLSMYLVERKRCLKWYMKIFKRLLYVSVHNSLVLLLSSLERRSMSEVTHRDFRVQLANSLVSAHRPSLRENLPLFVEDMRLRRDVVHIPKHLDSKSRMRCHLCKRKGISKHVNLKCVTCDEGMCFEGCWSDWHSLQELPGRNVHVRKTKRRRTH